jgi:nitronate monooxygenase
MPILQTSLTRLLNIELPIIQAPMGLAANPALVSAVSNAGGLGMLAATSLNPGEVRQVIQETRELTDRPFGVNLILRESIEHAEERLKIFLEEGTPIVHFFWGDPSPYIERVHAAGALVMHTVASAAEARRSVDAGVDVIVAQGWEAGGHVWGEVATLPLVPLVVDAVAPTPVVAAGGIADGRGMAAALALGAAGVWLGTRFLASEEAGAHPFYKEMLLQAKETDTFYSCLFDMVWPNAPHRALRNSTFNNWEAAGRPPSGQRPGEGDVIAHWADGRPIVRYGTIPYPGITGEIEAMALYAGQSVGLVKSIQPAGEIVRELADEAVRVLRYCASLAGEPS